ncbi:Protein of unknown function [Pyronema omphalodes CBS 100304]|uniref:Uncharacterized protein n=1 Tax=Pyronema omphalodes (strain CBS 100304) TaxID=1076935 RepID=U4LCQ8_PYROM|nr:Protein of unknown function [Pyronema omphalodes CBS 100304]
MPILGPRSQPASFRDRHRSQLPTPPGTPSKAAKEQLRSPLRSVYTHHSQGSHAYQSLDGRLSLPGSKDSSPLSLTESRSSSGSLTRKSSRQLHSRHSVHTTSSDYYLDTPDVVTRPVSYEDIYAAFEVRPPRLPSLSASKPAISSALPQDLDELPNEMLKRYNSHLEATFSGKGRGLPDISSIQKFERGVREAVV